MSTKLIVLKKHLPKLALVFVAMFGLGYWSTESLICSVSNKQSPNMSALLMNAKMGKALSFVNVQLESHATPENSDDEAEISGYITLLKTSNNTISYQWILPAGVEILEGDREGRVESVVIETPVEVRIKVKGFAKSEKKLLTLTASTQVGDTAFSNVQLISSRPEDSHEYIANQRFEDNQIQKLDLSSESGDVPSPRSQEEKIQQ